MFHPHPFGIRWPLYLEKRRFFKNFFADVIAIGIGGPLCFGISGLSSHFLYKKVVSLHFCTIAMSSCRLPTWSFPVFSFKNWRKLRCSPFFEYFKCILVICFWTLPAPSSPGPYWALQSRVVSACTKFSSILSTWLAGNWRVAFARRTRAWSYILQQYSCITTGSDHMYPQSQRYMYCAFVYK